MSPSISTRSGGRTSLRLLEGRPWRVVEAQHVLSTRALVDSDEEYELLEQLIEETKPRLPAEPAFRGLHYLLATPFRYPPLRHGSRFGTRAERSLWYGAEALETALAEHAYYRLLFFEGTSAALAPATITVTALRASVKTTAGVDLTRPPFHAPQAALTSRTSYAATQRLGAELRAAGVEALRYTSARDPKGGANLALFTPAAFAAKRPLRTQAWFCTVTAQRGVEYRRVDVGPVQKVSFERAVFLVDGVLPLPAA